jgi:hypothetical protein
MLSLRHDSTLSSTARARGDQSESDAGRIVFHRSRQMRVSRVPVEDDGQEQNMQVFATEDAAADGQAGESMHGCPQAQPELVSQEDLATTEGSADSGVACTKAQKRKPTATMEGMTEPRRPKQPHTTNRSHTEPSTRSHLVPPTSGWRKEKSRTSKTGEQC